MSVTRRQVVLGGLATAATVGLAACSGSTPKSGTAASSAAENATLNLAWWGNEVRNKNTNNMIAAYQTAHPGVKIAGAAGEFASYWDKLSTQVAGGNAPDVLQMDMAYIADYGTKGALLDLKSLDTSKFVEGTVDAGKIKGKLVGINAGINCLTLFADPKVFAKAGMQVPDDKTWTWDSLVDTAAELASKAGTPFGMAGLWGDTLFQGWLRQTGKQLFTETGPGYDASDVKTWFDYLLKAQKAGAIGSAAQIVEEQGKALGQSAIVTGKAGIGLFNSNQATAVYAAAGQTLPILRYPTITGNVKDRKAWYKASMLWSASSKTKNPDAALALINYLVNSTDAGLIQLAERGIPANTDVQAAVTPKLTTGDLAAQKFLADIKPELSDTPIAPPPGAGQAGTIMFRYLTDVLYGRQSSADASSKFVTELKSVIKA
jgi:multiple sugar transport system substrate-binding protein